MRKFQIAFIIFLSSFTITVHNLVVHCYRKSTIIQCWCLYHSNSALHYGPLAEGEKCNILQNHQNIMNFPSSNFLSALILTLLINPIVTKVRRQRQSWKYWNATNSPNFLKIWFQFSTTLSSLQESLDLSVQSDNHLTIVNQVIVLSAPVRTLWKSFWVSRSYFVNLHSFTFLPL